MGVQSRARGRSGRCARLGEVVVLRRVTFELSERCSRWHDPTPAGGRALRWHLLAPPGGVGCRLERCAHERDGSREIAEHELCADAHDAKARALKLAIAARVRAGDMFFAHICLAVSADGLRDPLGILVPGGKWLTRMTSPTLSAMR